MRGQRIRACVQQSFAGQVRRDSVKIVSALIPVGDSTAPTSKPEVDMPNDTRRTHLVLVPGFGGFDALGQLTYYAGVTSSFQRWQSIHDDRQVALHQFENLPTASVRTRALALRDFLDTRTSRGEFAVGDRLALIGHSTGGLDIRQLLVNLDPPTFADAAPDPTGGTRTSDEQILAKVQRLVFLSVPQRGANIADCVRTREWLVHKQIEGLALAVRASHAFEFLSDLERQLLQLNLGSTPQLVVAFRDAVRETIEPSHPRTAKQQYGAALARQAYGELNGWLGNVQADFFAIDDLACIGKPNTLPTPARYDDALRARELAAWAQRGIDTLSFATTSPPPLGQRPSTAVLGPLQDDLRLLKSAGQNDPNTDFVYRLAYAACAVGPFQVIASNGSAIDRQGVAHSFEAWQNDGVVNTASMLWPNAAATRLVVADHGDIIGHYQATGPVRASEQALGRPNHSYDILRSNAGFDDVTFEQTWHDVFDFCAR
jgi:triacylglycerol lipase